MFTPILFLLLTIGIVNEIRDTSTRFEVQEGLKAQFGTGFEAQVTSVGTFWGWLETSLLPAVRDQQALAYNLTAAQAGSMPLQVVLTQTRDTCGTDVPTSPRASFGGYGYSFPYSAPNATSWYPLEVPGVCTNSSSASSTVLLSFNRASLREFFKNGEQYYVTEPRRLCWLACEKTEECDSWTFREGAGLVMPPQYCELFRDALQPPSWTAGADCTSGQPLRVTAAGANWQCPGPHARPRYEFAPTTSAVAGSTSLHDHFFTCGFPSADFLGAPTSCILLGGQFDQFKQSTDLASTLARLGWIDVKTSSVTVQVLGINRFTLSPAFTLASFEAQFTPGGRTAVRSRMNAVVPATPADAAPPPLMVAALVVFLFAVLRSLAVLVRDAVHHARARRLPEFVMRNIIWILVEVAICLSSISLFAAYASRAATTSKAADAYQGCGGISGPKSGYLSEASCLAASPLNTATLVPTECSTASVPQQCGTPEQLLALLLPATARWLAEVKVYLLVDDTTRFAGTVTVYLLTFRLFRFFRLQPRLAIITNTLRRALPDLLHFGVIFALVLVGFAASAMTNFGDRVSSFTTPGDSFFQAFYMAMGASSYTHPPARPPARPPRSPPAPCLPKELTPDLACFPRCPSFSLCAALIAVLTGNYDTPYQDMEQTGVISARLFCIPFLFLVVLVLLNIFLAIVVDAYSDVKDELHNDDAVPSIIDSSLAKLRELRHAAQRTTARALAKARGGGGLRRRRATGAAAAGVEMLPTGALSSASIDDSGSGVGSGGITRAGGREFSLKWPAMLRALEAVGDVDIVTAELLQKSMPGTTLAEAESTLAKYSAYATAADTVETVAAGLGVVKGKDGKISITSPSARRSSLASTTSAEVALSADDLARIVREACDERLAPVLRNLEAMTAGMAAQ
jgi:hypothetical protein